MHYICINYFHRLKVTSEDAYTCTAFLFRSNYIRTMINSQHLITQLFNCKHRLRDAKQFLSRHNFQSAANTNGNSIYLYPPSVITIFHEWNKIRSYTKKIKFSNSFMILFTIIMFLPIRRLSRQKTNFSPSYFASISSCSACLVGIIVGKNAVLYLTMSPNTI